MEQKRTSNIDWNSKWIDLTNPSEAELMELAEKHNLHPNSVHDSLKPDHLPKYEEIDGNKFIVSRIYDPQQKADSNTIQEVSRKISIFIANDVIITIHRSEQPLLGMIKEKYVDTGKCSDIQHLVAIILNGVILSYEPPAEKISTEIDFYEEKIFLKKKLPDLLKGLYRIRRKVSAIRRILMLSKDILNRMETDKKKDPVLRELLDNYIQQDTIYDQLSEQINNLLSLYLSISAQKTNEVIRVLTIFSVFFLPLTFIVGVYGMNFNRMPEINWEYGYLYSIILMIVITIIIYYWFKRKQWL